MTLQRVRANLQRSRFITVASTLFIRAGSAGLQFFLNVVLGRLLGPASLGTYYLFVSWTNLGGAIGGVGLPTLTLRTTARLVATNQRQSAHRFWRRSILLVGVITGCLAALAYLLRYKLAVILLGDASLSYLVAMIAWAVVPFTLLTLSAATLKAQNHPNLGLSLEFALLPIFLLAWVCYFYFTNTALLIANFLVAYSIFLVVVVVLALFTVEYTFKSNASLAIVANVDFPSMQSVVPQAFRFWLINLLTRTTANVPFILLPYFSSQEQIGFFGVAHRLISTATLVLLAISSIYSPLFAAAYAQKSPKVLRTLLRQTQIYSIAAYLPLLFVFLFASDWVLSLYGEQFVAAKPYLFIFAFGQFINSATGLVTFLNLMTENEEFETKVSTVTLICTIVLSIAIANTYGAMGVAIAITVSLAFKNILSYFKALRTLNLLADV